MIFYFAKASHPPQPPHRTFVPDIAPSACNIAIVDSTTVFEPISTNPIGWTLRRIATWPFPRDGPRTAHFLKVLPTLPTAYYLLPTAYCPLPTSYWLTSSRCGLF